MKLATQFANALVCTDEGTQDRKDILALYESAGGRFSTFKGANSKLLVVTFPDDSACALDTITGELTTHRDPLALMLQLIEADPAYVRDTWASICESLPAEEQPDAERMGQALGL